MLTAEQRREILAVALLAVGLFLLLSLLPVDLFGARGEEWFPSGNMMGIVGGTLQGLSTALLGATAYLLPALVVLAALYLGEWVSPGLALRGAVLGAGLLLLLPTATWVFTAGPVGSGWLGRAVGAPLQEWLGWLGAVLVCGVGLVALSVGTLGWNPLRSVGRGLVAGGDVAGRAARTLADKHREAAEARALAAAEAQVEEASEVSDESPVPGLEPTWLEGDGDEEEDPDDEEAPWEGSSEWEDDDEADTELDDAETAVPTGGRRRAAPVDDAFPDPNAPDGSDHEVPPVDLLSAPERVDRANMERELDELGKILIEKLRTFNVESELGGRTTGPVVTQFEVVPAPGVKVNRIANLDADLALAMKAQTIRIVAPIPGKGAVGVEIPNPEPEIVQPPRDPGDPRVPERQGRASPRAREGPDGQRLRAPTSRRCRTCSSRAPPAPASRCASTPSSRASCTGTRRRRSGCS